MQGATVVRVVGRGQGRGSECVGVACHCRRYYIQRDTEEAGVRRILRGAKQASDGGG